MMCRDSEIPPTGELWWILKINKHFRPPVGAVSTRTESAQLKTAHTKLETDRCVFLTAPVGNVPLILRFTINIPIQVDLLP